MVDSMNAYERNKAVVKIAGSEQEGVSEWLKYVKDDIGSNLLTKKELASSAAIGSVATGLIGLGIGALFSNRKNRRRRMIKGAILGALAGGIGGPAYRQLRKYLDGIPYRNDKFDLSKIKSGDRVYIGVSGSANGEGHSAFMNSLANGVSDFVGDGKLLARRHVDYDKIEEDYKALKAKGADVVLVGHSSGGATAARFLRNHPDAKGILLDPVSWTGRGVPENAVVFTSDASTRNNPVFENIVANAGGRWNYQGKNSITYKGNHTDPSIFDNYLFPMIKGKKDPKDLLGVK